MYIPIGFFEGYLQFYNFYDISQKKKEGAQKKTCPYIDKEKE